MPEPEPTPTENKLKDRVAKLEAAVAFLLKGSKRVSEEIGSEWGEETFGDGEHLGVRFSAQT